LLARTLGPVQLISAGVGCTIGGGIFLTTSTMARQYGAPSLLAGYLVAALGCALTALCYAEFAATEPGAGSAYQYARAALGRFPAWIIGCLLFLEYSFGAAAVAVLWTGSAWGGALAAAVDRASGLSTPEHLHEVLRRDWSIGQRDGRALTLMRFDVDAYRDYHEVFGRVATENMVRQLGRTIGSAMRRTSDVVARFGDDEFVALGVAMEQSAACAHAEVILGRVRALAIHHPRSRVGRFVTMSAGVVSAVPPRDRGCDALLDAAQRALAAAKHEGGNRVAGSGL